MNNNNSELTSQTPRQTINSRFNNFKSFIFSKNFRNWFPIIILVISLPIVVIVALQVQNLRQRAAPAIDRSLAGLSNTLLQKGSENLLQVAGTDRITNEYDAVNAAKSRKEIMLKIAEENPKEFLLYAFPTKVKGGLTKDAQQYIENEVDIKGELMVLHFDNFNEKKQKTEYRLLIKDGNKVTADYKINFAGKVPTSLSGSKATLKGYRLDNELVVEGGDGGGFEIVDPQQPSAIGDQKTLVILFNFQNDNYEPVSKDEVRNLIFGDTNSVGSYYKEISYNKTSFSGDIVGYYKIPYSNLDCGQSYDWAISAETIAYTNGINLDNYPRRVYVFPSKGNCWASAWSTIGGIPSKVWMTDSETSPDFNEAKYPGIYSHEMGHSLGVNHANSYECIDKQVGDFENYSDCSSKEYGDPTDVMGFSSWTNIYGFDAPHRDEVKWIDPGQIANISGNGTYNVYPLNESISSIKTLKIPIPNSFQYYYVSYRKAESYDSSLSSGITGGVSIHVFSDSPYVDSSNPTNLIDNYPEGQPYNDFSNSSLRDGGEFNDPYNGIKIQQLSHDSNFATVNIALDKSVCRRGVPDFTIDPISASGSQGELVTYQIYLKDNDTSNCGASDFGFSDDKYDWSSTYSQATVTLNPGESKIITKTMTPPYNARVGIYTINTTINGSIPRHNETFTNSFIVTGSLGFLNVSPGKIDTGVGKEVGISALAYDSNGNQIRQGVTYQWSMSSTNSVATLSRTDGVVNTIFGLKPGFGELTVIANFNGGQITKTIQVSVSGTTPTPTPTVIPPRTVSIIPLADTYAKSTIPSKNFGNSNILWADGNPIIISFLKFDLSSLAGKTITNAKLKLTVANVTNAQSLGSFKLNSADSSWSESKLTYKRMPRVGDQIGSFGPVKKNQIVEIDLTDLVKQQSGQIVTFAISDLSSDDVAIKSKETTSVSSKPTLVVQYK